MRQELMALMAAAPPPVRRALGELMGSIKAGLEAAGQTPKFIDARARVYDWRNLLPMLTDIRAKLDRPIAARLRRRGKAKTELVRLEEQFALLRRAHEQMSLMFQISYALVNVGGEFQTSEEVLEQSAEVLIELLEADLFVCRLRDEYGEWVNVAANTQHGTSTPILVRAMEESIPGHPVMQAVASKQWSYVLSNNLMSSERGGESYDCVAYQEGYRSRLAFILRGHDTQPFGLIMLYSRAEAFFGGYDHQFLSDCSRIVSLTVGSRLEVGRDALSKASGGMAHVGNNALSVIKNCLELVKEDMEAGIRAGAAPLLRQFRTSFDLAREIELIGCALGGAERLRGAIANLLDAVDHPRIMHYIRGEEVLDLDPRSPQDEEG
ncbi:MAG: hypothetical protein A2051_06095 [Desulfovibrionales bacterium GWA2_65_9]|nr:MAG: hypothetical protein A2051_06095 [Desulfovibrionales bacterium GWA2_65_9]